MIKPLRNYILIELIEDQEKMQGGIVIPEKTQERQAKGKVIALGKPPYLNYELEEDLEIKKNDVVWFKRFAGEKVVDGGKEYLLCPYREILGKVV